MKKPVLFLMMLMISLSLNAQSAQPAQPRVGVLDFKGNNISESDAQVVGEMFTSELVLSGKYDVVDRKNIESIMQEMDFQLSGCTDSSCALEIGQILSLDKMLYGSINKLGKDFIINVYMIDVVTAQIEGTARERFGSLEESYDIMGLLIRKLVHSSGSEPGTQAPGADTAAGSTSEPADSPSVSSPSAGSVEPVNEGGLYLEAGLGAIIGDEQSGIGLEAGVRYMFNNFWGLGLSALIGFPFDDGVYFGLDARGYIQLFDDIGFSLGFKGFPEYINSYGGICLGVYIGDFFIKGGIQVIAGSGGNIDIGYAFRL